MRNIQDVAFQVIQTLKKHHHEAYIVGGAVRDQLLHREINDIDIVTSAPAEEVEEIFDKTFRMNNQFETVVVRVEGFSFEITTMRSDSIEKDLKKRDLTINSIALDEEGFIDPTNGLNDIKNEILRSYDVDERMTEDPLRMLRVFRFVSELDFHVETELAEVIKKRGSLLLEVAIERITKEWLELLKGKQKNRGLSGLIETELYRYIPHFSLTIAQLQYMLKWETLKQESDMFCWYLFCLSSKKQEPHILKDLALSNEIIREVKSRLYFYHMREKSLWTPLTIYKATKPVVFDVEKARKHFQLEAQPNEQLKRMWDDLPIKTRQDLKITGKDLIKSKKPGPWVKESLEWAEKAVILNEVENCKEHLLMALERKMSEC